MQKEQVRLELVKLCERKDLEPERTLERVKKYEAFIYEQAEPVKANVQSSNNTGGKHNKKGAGNPDILS